MINDSTFNDEHLSYGWQYKFSLFTSYFNQHLKLPETGAILQMGSSMGCSLEKLCWLYGYQRCTGWDIVNPLGHPRIIIKDCNSLTAQDNMPLALVHVDTGSVANHKDSSLRKHSLHFAARNLVKGGHLFTIGYGSYVEDQFGFNVAELLSQYGLVCMPAVDFLNIDESTIKKYYANGVDLRMELYGVKP